MATQSFSDPKVDRNIDEGVQNTETSKDSSTINNNIFLDITDNKMPKAYNINL